MQRKLALVLPLVVVALWVQACNDCEFMSRCKGNSRQVCGDGVDHQIGREIESTPCEELNPVCMSKDGAAICTVDVNPHCEPSDTRCEGGVLVACSEALGHARRVLGAHGLHPAALEWSLSGRRRGQCELPS